MLFKPGIPGLDSRCDFIGASVAAGLTFRRKRIGSRTNGVIQT